MLLPLAFLHLSFRLTHGRGEGKATRTLAPAARPDPKGHGSAMPSVTNLHGEVCTLLLLGANFDSCLNAFLNMYIYIYICDLRSFVWM